VAAQTLRTIAADPRHLGAQIGATLVLHTWGSALTHHPHVHGIVPGGGIALLRARSVLEKVKKEVRYEDEKTGIDILYRTLSEPVRRIAENAGADPGWVVKKVDEAKTVDYGFNALTNEFGSMVAAGILDPAKVTRLALQNAVSIGSMVLTTEAMICDLPEKKEGPAMPPGGGMGGMGGMGDY